MSPLAPPALAETAATADQPAVSPKATPPPSLGRLQRDLEAAQAEARCLHELLEDLPEILERKFQMRLEGLLAEQRQLQHGNAFLHHQLLVLHSSGPAPTGKQTGLPPAADTPVPNPPTERPITQGLGLRRALRHLHP